MTGGPPPPTPSPHRDAAKLLVDQALAQHATLPPAQRQQFQWAAHGVFDQLTSEALERFNRNVAGYRFFPTTHELSLAIVPGYATLPAVAQQYARASGSYNRATRELELDGDDHVSGVPVPLPDRYAHEFSHAIDGPNREISSTQEWADAWRAEIRPNPPTRTPPATPTRGSRRSLPWPSGATPTERPWNEATRSAWLSGGPITCGKRA